MIINRYHIQTPITIITTTLGIPENYKQRCVQEAYKIGDKQGKKTNVQAIMSSYMVWEETDVYGLLLDNILKVILDKSIYINRGTYKYSLVNAWTAIYKEGHYTLPHNHQVDSIMWSFVYYLRANDSSTPLIFENCDFNIMPQDDLLVVFPSYLMHSVPTHKGGDRICLAGNIQGLGK